MSELLADEELLEEETRIDLPRWVEALVIPLLNVSAALLVSALIVLLLGENPFAAVYYLVRGAFGYQEAIGYTLFYATSFVFTGLAVAVAFHCGLLNLGGEGQAYIGGLGVALACLALGDMPVIAVLPVALLSGAALGALWGAIPGYLQGARGSHIVITTIMFNFLAASLVVYVVVNALVAPGQTAAESPEFGQGAWLPKIHEIAENYGYEVAASPLNISAVLALLAAFGVWILLWHTRLGYQIRVVGKDHMAATYAGISPTSNIIVAMAISGALASMLGINELMGAQHRLVVNFVAGYGIAGVAVALMGRNHPFGIFLSALLFGALYQGGAELSFEIPSIPREMVILIQGLIVLFNGALERLFRPYVATLWQRRGIARDIWRKQKERIKATRARRRAARLDSSYRRKAAAAAAAGRKQRGAAAEPEPEPVVYDKEVSRMFARERGEKEYRDLLHKRGIHTEDPVEEEKPKRRRWLPRLPKLPKINISVQKPDGGDSDGGDSDGGDSDGGNKE